MSAENKPQRVTPKKQLVALVRECETKRSRAQSITVEIGERVKTAVESGHLNRKAFAMIRALFRMDEDKRNDVLRSFDLYRDYCVEERLFGDVHVGDLLDGQGDDEPAEGADESAPLDADAEQAAKNETALQEGLKTLDPTFEDDATSSRPSRRRGTILGDTPGTFGKTH